MSRRSCRNWQRFLLSVASAASALALFALPSLCSAQLIVGVDDATEGIWNMNPSNNSVQTFLPGNAGTNLATDEVNKILYFMSNTVQPALPLSAPERARALQPLMDAHGPEIDRRREVTSPERR